MEVIRNKKAPVSLKRYMYMKLEMLNSLGRYEGGCNGVLCRKCPLSKDKNGKDINCIELETIYPEIAAQIVSDFVSNLVDWTKVEVDTKVLVSQDGVSWFSNHFAKYENGLIYVWEGGRTLFSIRGCYESSAVIGWKYGKIYRE